MIAPRPVERAEHRVDAVSSAPGDSPTSSNTAIIGRVFARSATATLGVLHAHGRVSASRIIPSSPPPTRRSILAKDAAEGDAADAGITAHVIERRPACNARTFSAAKIKPFSPASRKRLRADLSTAVSDLLDRQVLAGDGTTGAEFDGFLATAGERRACRIGRDSPGRATFALAAGETARGIDGKYSGALSECTIVIGDDTARDLAGKFQNRRTPTAALAYMGRTTRKDDGVGEYPGRRERRSKRPSWPAWARPARTPWLPVVVESMFAVRDEISGRKSGQIAHHHRHVVRLRHPAGRRASRGSNLRSPDHRDVREVHGVVIAAHGAPPARAAGARSWFNLFARPAPPHPRGSP